MAITSLYGYQLVKGTIYQTKTINKFGFNDAVGTSKQTISDVGSNYTNLTVAQSLNVSSSNTNDTSGGTGARTLILYGIDGDYNEISETITLNGQTNVATSKSYLRLYRAKVLTAGSGATAEGDIYVGYGTNTAGVPATPLIKIVTGENQTLMACWTVPAGYTGYLYSCTFSSGSETGQKYMIARLEVKEYGSVWQTKEKGTFSTANLVFSRDIPLQIPEKSDIRLTAQTSSGTFDVSGVFALVYEKN